MDYKAILKSIKETLMQTASEAKKKTTADTLQPISVETWQDTRVKCPKCTHSVDSHNYYKCGCNGEIETSIEIGKDGFKRIRTKLDACTCDLTRFDVQLNLEEPPSA